MENRKKILIPTDFTVASLNLVKEAIDHYPQHELEIMLVLGINIPSGITEMLFFSKEKHLNQIRSGAFLEACSLLQNKYGKRLIRISSDLIINGGRNYIEHFLNYEQIDELGVSVNYKLNLKNKLFFDPTKSLQHSSRSALELNWSYNQDQTMPLTNQLSDLFLPT